MCSHFHKWLLMAIRRRVKQQKNVCSIIFIVILVCAFCYCVECLCAPGTTYSMLRISIYNENSGVHNFTKNLNSFDMVGMATAFIINVLLFYLLVTFRPLFHLRWFVPFSLHRPLSLAHSLYK